MSYASPVHKVFAAFWLGVWAPGLIAYLWWFDRNVWVDAAFIAAFLVAEGIALVKRGSLRDTLSEVMTWFARFSKPGARWYQSWNAAMLAITAHVVWLVARQPEPLLMKVALGLFTSSFLLWHWLRPEKVG